MQATGSFGLFWFVFLLLGCVGEGAGLREPSWAPRMPLAGMDSVCLRLRRTFRLYIDRGTDCLIILFNIQIRYRIYSGLRV